MHQAYQSRVLYGLAEKLGVPVSAPPQPLDFPSVAEDLLAYGDEHLWRVDDAPPRMNPTEQAARLGVPILPAIPTIIAH